MKTGPASARPAWSALQAHVDRMRGRHLRELFAQDPARGERYAAEAAGIYLDYSKNRITDETLDLLLELADQCGLQRRMEAMFAGAPINASEGRPALHVALRSTPEQVFEANGRNVTPEVHEVLRRMERFATEVRDGRRRGYTGKPLDAIVNIGIGGSALGPIMAYEALRHYTRRDLSVRFISNIDPTDFVETTRDLEPERTLFIVCSKSFGTLETLTNAHAARLWCLEALGDEEALRHHFVAVSSNREAVAGFGMDPDNMFEFWDWVGGRYSMDSAVGLSTMIAIGPTRFHEMLAGFRAMDEHFRQAPPRENLPVLMGLMAVWNTSFLGIETVAVLPYEQYLWRLPAYLQQLAMESNGKHVTQYGELVDYQTGPIYWGEAGTNGQHSFYQLLHQGTRLVACDFIGFCRSLNPLGDQHEMLMANLFAQAEALAFGRTLDEVRQAGSPEDQAAHRVVRGNRPSNTLLLERLTPHALGTLLALYEHSVFTQGTLWNIDSYDQWGVELGKTLARRTTPELEAPRLPRLEHDSSTNLLIRRFRQFNGDPS